MSKRSTQGGTVVKKGLWWHVRYLMDTPNGRIHKSDAIGKICDLTKTKAKRLAGEYLEKLGINSPEHWRRAMSIPTFAAAYEKWRTGALPSYKPSTSQPAGYVAAKHIFPRFGAMTLEAVDKHAIQMWVNDLAKSELAPKTVSNVVKILKMILGYSEKFIVGRIKLPVIPQGQQRWFTAKEYDSIIAGADAFPERRKRYRLLLRQRLPGL